MLFEDISELGSHLSYGFKIDHVISVLQKSNHEIKDEDKKIFKFISEYFNLAKEGFNFYYQQKYPEVDADEALNAFSIIVSALIENFDKKDLKITDFLHELKIFEKEITRLSADGSSHKPSVTLSMEAAASIVAMIGFYRLPKLIHSLLKLFKDSDSSELINFDFSDRNIYKFDNLA